MLLVVLGLVVGTVLAVYSRRRGRLVRRRDAALIASIDPTAGAGMARRTTRARGRSAL